MIFTAMAVLAFSAVSVANTIEVKEEVVVNNETKVEKTVVLDDADTCREFAMGMTDMVDLDPVATHDFYQAMYNLCYYFNN